MPGLNPGITRTVAGAARPTDGDLAAALGLPGAGAGAVAAAPGAAAAGGGEAAGAGCGLAADADGCGAGIAQIPIGDADRIAIGRITDPFLRDDHHAPDPIVARHGLGRTKRWKRGYRRERGHQRKAP